MNVRRTTKRDVEGTIFSVSAEREFAIKKEIIVERILASIPSTCHTPGDYCDRCRAFNYLENLDTQTILDLNEDSLFSIIKNGISS